MIRNSLGLFIGVIATSCACSLQAAATTWVDTDKISNSRNLQMQIDVDSIDYRKDWIHFLQRIKDLDNLKTYTPWEIGINCSKGVLVELLSGSGKSTQFRRNRKWFKDFVNENDASDLISVEIKAEDDAYREETYSLVCKRYNR